MFYYSVLGVSVQMLAFFSPGCKLFPVHNIYLSAYYLSEVNELSSCGIFYYLTEKV